MALQFKILGSKMSCTLRLKCYKMKHAIRTPSEGCVTTSRLFHGYVSPFMLEKLKVREETYRRTDVDVKLRYALKEEKIILLS